MIAEPALDRPQPADAAFAHERPHPLPLRMMDHDVGLLDLQAGLVADGDQGSGLRRVERDRLLAEHVLAGPRRFLGPRDVEVVGQRVVNHVDRGIGQHRLVVAVGLGQAELFGHRLRLGQLAARYAVDAHARSLLQRRDHVLDGEKRGAEHAPRERRHRILPRPVRAAPSCGKARRGSRERTPSASPRVRFPSRRASSSENRRPGKHRRRRIDHTRSGIAIGPAAAHANMFLLCCISINGIGNYARVPTRSLWFGIAPADAGT